MSQDLTKDGFHKFFGQSWIYPINLPVRTYQKQITEEALYKNTMVCLPTGLGKTFIAAVVMYNFFRWYPHGKVIFMAPTRPLVKQQMDACYNIVAIPKEATIELTGQKIKSLRDNIWKDKRIFFVTPQVLQNDLDRIADLGADIKCLVFDEAHRARGNHAYCEVIRKLQPVNKNFRVLALTATPATQVDDVVTVCQSLLIAHLEIRNDDSPDVQPYVFKRSFEVIVITMDGELLQFKERYINIIDKQLRILINNNVIRGNANSLHKGKLFYITKEYTEKHRYISSSHTYKLIVRTLNTCSILYHGLDVLMKNGLRTFLTFFEDNIDKPLLMCCSDELRNLMDDVRQYLGPKPILDILPDGSVPKLPKNSKFGHPKYYKISEILLDHFKERNKESHVIIFSEYRDSVMEIQAALSQYNDIIKSRVFMGQSSLGQKQQLNIIESFKSGSYNTLISTCIGEEGIDIGAVDLVVCFDISNKSSIRMIQRMGRTGRKRDGRVIMLVTEGREHTVLKECLQQKRFIENTLIKSRDIADQLYKENPRMVPDDVVPECLEMAIEVNQQLNKSRNIISMFESANRSKINESIGDVLQERLEPVDGSKYNHLFPAVSSLSIDGDSKIKYGSQLKLQSCLGEIGSSENSCLLVAMRNVIDFSRHKISMDSNELEIKSKPKQATIKDMFLKQNAARIESSPSQTVNVFEKELNTELTNVLSTAKPYQCFFCNNLFSCNLKSNNSIDFLTPWEVARIDLKTILTRQNIEIEINKTMRKLQEKTVNLEETIIEKSFAKTTIPESNEPIELLHEDFHMTSMVFDNSNDNTANCLESNFDETVVKDTSAVVEKEELQFFKLNSLSELFTDVVIDESIEKTDNLHLDLECDKKSVDVSSAAVSEEELLVFFKLKHLSELFTDVANANDESVGYNYESRIKEFDSDVDKRSVELFEEGCSEIQGLNLPELKGFTEDILDEINTSPVIGNSQMILEETCLEEGLVWSSDEDGTKSPVLSLTGRLMKRKLMSQSSQKENFDSNISNLKSNPKTSVFNEPTVLKSYVLESNKSANLSLCDIFTDSILSIGNADGNKTKETKAVVEKVENLAQFKDFFDDSVLSKIGKFSEKDIPLPSTNTNNNLENSFQSPLPKKIPKVVKETKKLLLSRKSTANINEEDSDEDLLKLNTSVSYRKANLECNSLSVTNRDKFRDLTKDLSKASTSKKFLLSSKKNTCSDDDDDESDEDLLKLNARKREVLNTSKMDDSFFRVPNSKPYTNYNDRRKTNQEIFNDYSPKSAKNLERDKRMSNYNLSLDKSPSTSRTNLGNNQLDDDFKHTPKLVKRKRSRLLKTNKRRMKRPKNDFVEDEADVSYDFDVSSDESVAGTQNGYEESFVNDNTVNDAAYMRKHYLESVRSPRKRNVFKVPALKPFVPEDVFSQRVSPDCTSYQNDSFCVDSEEECVSEESELEIAERLLEEKKKKKKKAGSKWRRIRRISDSE